MLRKKRVFLRFFSGVDWESASQNDFDFSRFELGAQNDSPFKKGYGCDSDYEPESERLSSEAVKEEELRFKKKARKSGKHNVHVVASIDFTLGQTQMDARNKVQDQMSCHIIQKVLQDEIPYNYEGVFYKCAKNWVGTIQKGLVVSSDGLFSVHCAGKGMYLKNVSQKDRFVYHDSCRINASKLVYCSFVKNHPGLQGEAEEDYRIHNFNGPLYDLSIDNLELRKVNRIF